MFCKKCGANVGESSFCPNCGTIVGEAEEIKRTYNTHSPQYFKSLSFIPVSLLTVITIVLLFIKKFAKCWSKTTMEGYRKNIDTFYESFSSMADSVVLPSIAIILLLVPVAITVINFFARKQKLTYFAAGSSALSLIYMVIASLIVSENYDSYDVVNSPYFGKMTYEFDFLNFSLTFYLILATILLIGVICVLDALGKPLLKLKINQD